MKTAIGINGFGRIGRLALRAGWQNPHLQFAHINEAAGDGATSAHLLEFDSVHGRWSRQISGTADAVTIEGHKLSHSSEKDFAKVPWGEMGVEIVLEASGKFRTPEQLEAYFKAGTHRSRTACSRSSAKQALKR